MYHFNGLSGKTQEAMNTLKKEDQMKTTSRFLTVLTVMSLMLFFVTGVMAEDKYPVPPDGEGLGLRRQVCEI